MREREPWNVRVGKRMQAQGDAMSKTGSKLMWTGFWWTAIIVFFVLLGCGRADAETWKKDRYGYETYRSDKGEVWKKDRYGYDTWRSNTGEVCKRDRYGGAVRCSK